MSAEAAPVERSDIRPAVRELAGDLLPDAPRLASNWPPSGARYGMPRIAGLGRNP
jgi:hypothetical protein